MKGMLARFRNCSTATSSTWTPFVHALIGNLPLVSSATSTVRTYAVVGLYDDLAEQGRIIRKEQEGVRVLVDLKKGDKADAIQAIEDVLSQLKG